MFQPVIIIVTNIVTYTTIIIVIIIVTYTNLIHCNSYMIQPYNLYIILTVTTCNHYSKQYNNHYSNQHYNQSIQSLYIITIICFNLIEDYNIIAVILFNL